MTVLGGIRATAVGTPDLAAAVDPAATPIAEERPSPRAWYILAIAVVATLFGFVDRQVLVVLAEPIKHDLALSDGQLGLIQGLGPGLLAAVGAVALGWLTDRTARQMVLAVAVLGWSIATAGCAMAHSFWHLLAGGVAIGIGEAALSPVLLSIFPDLFPGRSRITANLVFAGAALVGGGVGIALAGAAAGLVQAHGHALPLGLGKLAAWRVAFLIAALPGPPMALIIAFVGPIRRTVVPPATAAHTSLTAYLKHHWQALAGLMAAICTYSMGIYAIILWGPVYVMRVLKASAAQAGAGFGVALICGSLVGVVGAGFAARWLSARLGAVGPLRVLQSGLWLALLPILGLLLPGSAIFVYVLTGLVLAAAVMGGSLVSTLLQDLTPPGLRGRVISLCTPLTVAAGGVGPIVVGLVSDRVPQGSHALIWTIVAIALPGFFVAALAVSVIDKPFRRTAAIFSADQPDSASGPHRSIPSGRDECGDGVVRLPLA